MASDVQREDDEINRRPRMPTGGQRWVKRASPRRPRTELAGHDLRILRRPAKSAGQPVGRRRHHTRMDAALAASLSHL